MIDVTVDAESRSRINLKNCGLYRYAEDCSTEALLFSWKVEDNSVTSTWVYGQPCPDELAYLVDIPDVIFHAWNAQMEIELWDKVLHRRLGWPAPPPLHRWRCTMALAGCSGYPQDLYTASRVIGNGAIKLDIGDELINFFCKPDKKGNFNDPRKHVKKFAEFIRYNKGDVNSERDIHNVLKGIMTESEQKIWEHVVLMNQRGLPIDKELLNSVISHVEKDVKYMSAVVSILTSGTVTRPTQTQRIVKYVKRFGLNIPDLQEETVTNILDEDKLLHNLHPTVKQLLEFRQLGSSSSIGKFIKIKDTLCEDGTVKGCLRYYGAGPGRHSGLGFQPQNLPRYKHKDVESVIYAFNNFNYDLLRIIYPISQAAKGLIRPTICAPPGFEFLVQDFKGVEARAVCWLCDEQELIEKILAGLDLYKLQAAAVFGMRYEDIGKESIERQVGKILVLSCGYAGGYVVFLKEAKKNKKITCTESDAKTYVRLFRQARPKVTSAWKKFEIAALEAFIQPGEYSQVEGMPVLFQKFRNFLRMYLPSGRFIYYPDVELEDKFNRFGNMQTTVTSMWVNSKTHKWERRDMSGPLFFQNCIQGLCRDLLTSGQLRAEFQGGIPQIGSIHDEGIGLNKIGSGITDKIMGQYFCQLDKWAEGFPIDTSGFAGTRYKKD